MTKTQEVYTYKDIEEKFQLIEFDDIKEVLEELGEKENLFIKPLQLFDDGNHFGGEFLDIPTVKEIFDDNVMIELEGGNTYNYGGQMSNDIQWSIFESEHSEHVVVMFSFHIGRDIRAGYTKDIPVLFESNYEFQEFFSSNCALARVSFKQDDKTYTMYVDGSATSEYFDIWIDSDDNTNNLSYDEQPYSIDLYNEEYLLDSIAEYLQDNNIEFEKDSLTLLK